MGKMEEINFVEQVQHYFCKSVQDRKLEVAIKETLFGGARQTDITTGQTDTHQKVIATRPTDRQTDRLPCFCQLTSRLLPVASV